MGSWNIEEAKAQYPGSEQETIRKLAEAGSYLRVFKLANDYGDKITHTNYYTCASASEELSLFKSPYVHNVVLVYDRGRFVNQPVTFKDTDEGRDISGISLL